MSYTYDAAKRATQVSGSYNGQATTYASVGPDAGGVSKYWPHGPAQNMTLGGLASGTTGLAESTTFNSRLQVTGITVTPQSGGQALLSLGYSYGTWNNGNVRTHTILTEA